VVTTKFRTFLIICYQPFSLGQKGVVLGASKSVFTSLLRILHNKRSAVTHAAEKINDKKSLNQLRLISVTLYIDCAQAFNCICFKYFSLFGTEEDISFTQQQLRLGGTFLFSNTPGT